MRIINTPLPSLKLSWRMDVVRTNSFVVRGRMMFGEVITVIIAARFPMDLKLGLLDAILQPVKTHVDGLGAFLLDGGVQNTGSTLIISLDRRSRLKMTEFDEGGA